jgi:hypothetical protein
LRGETGKFVATRPSALPQHAFAGRHPVQLGPYNSHWKRPLLFAKQAIDRLAARYLIEDKARYTDAPNRPLSCSPRAPWVQLQRMTASRHNVPHHPAGSWQVVLLIAMIYAESESAHV